MALDAPTVTYVTPWSILGGNYAVALAQPFGYVDVNVGIAPIGVNSDNHAFGLGDTILTPVILGWHKGDWHWNFNFDIFAPTGQYDASQAVNLSLHHWAFNPEFAVTYFYPKSGFDVSVAMGYTINTQNPTTHYTSGDVFHVDWAVGKTIVKDWRVGIVGYTWTQVTADSGSGAKLGPFESDVYGIGPAVNYQTAIGKTPVSLELKYYYEFASQDRLQGSAIYFNITAQF
jgi:hypothetical protein